MISVTLTFVWSAILLALMLILAGLLKYRAWTLDGIRVMVSNREDVPEPGPLAARADRAAANMVENMVVFVALAAAILTAGRENETARLGANVFLWARLAYWPVYLAGIEFVRTALWIASLAGLAMMAWAFV